MNCKEFRTALALQTGDDLPADQIRELEQHLAACDACAAEQNRLQEIRSQLLLLDPDDPLDSVPLGFTARTMSRIRERKHRTWRSRFNAARPRIALAGFSVVALLVAVSSFTFWMYSDDFSKQTFASTAVHWSELSAEFGDCLEKPVRLSDWIPQPEPVVLIVMHPSSEEKNHFVIDYCGEFERLAALRSYPWIHTRERALYAHVGNREDVYVAACYLENALPGNRREIAERVIERYRPYFNTEQGES